MGFSNERRKTIYRNGNDRVDTMLKDKVLEQALQKVLILKMLTGRHVQKINTIKTNCVEMKSLSKPS